MAVQVDKWDDVTTSNVTRGHPLPTIQDGLQQAVNSIRCLMPVTDVPTQTGTDCQTRIPELTVQGDS